MSHVPAFGPSYQVLKATFHADDGDRPSDGEVLVCCLLMAYANGASEDTTELKSWADRIITDIPDLCPVATISERNWKPEAVCTHGKGAHSIPKSGLNISW